MSQIISLPDISPSLKLATRNSSSPKKLVPGSKGTAGYFRDLLHLIVVDVGVQRERRRRRRAASDVVSRRRNVDHDPVVVGLDPDGPVGHRLTELKSETDLGCL